jgi:hypothetical protein
MDTGYTELDTLVNHAVTGHEHRVDISGSTPAQPRAPAPAASPTEVSASGHTSIRTCVRQYQERPPATPAEQARSQARMSGRYRASSDRTVSIASTARSLSADWIAISGMYSSSGRSIRAQRLPAGNDTATTSDHGTSR